MININTIPSNDFLQNFLGNNCTNLFCHGFDYSRQSITSPDTIEAFKNLSNLSFNDSSSHVFSNIYQQIETATDFIIEKASNATSNVASNLFSDLKAGFKNSLIDVENNIKDKLKKSFKTLKKKLQDNSDDFFTSLGEEIRKVSKRFGKDSSNLLSDILSNANMSEKTHLFGKEIIKNLKTLGEDLGEGLKEFNTNVFGGIVSAIRNIGLRLLFEVTPIFLLIGLSPLFVTLLAIYTYKKAVYYLGRPKLATQQKIVSRFSIIPNFIKDTVTKVKKLFFDVKDKPLPIFNNYITGRIDKITEDIQNIRKNNGYMQNVLLYGPPGTGKTMISKTIAEKAGMNYVMMSGGDLPQYIKRGEHVTELNRLIDSVEKSSQPTIIFIDEAESLCRDRNSLTQEMLELQNAFLNRTGTQTKKFMLILATNRKDDLDSAILSRMDYKIQINEPRFSERAKIIYMYAEEFFSEYELHKYFNSVRCKSLALRTSGFSGRNIYKLMNTINNRKHATKDGKLSHPLINKVVAEFTKQERSQHSHSISTKVKLAIKDMLSYLALLFAKPYFLIYGY